MGHIPAAVLLNITKVLGFQQVPSTKGFHVLSRGMHWIQVKRAASPRTTFTEPRMNQMDMRILPSDILSSVIAKLVLLHAAAMREKNPERLRTRRRGARS